MTLPINPTALRSSCPVEDCRWHLLRCVVIWRVYVSTLLRAEHLHLGMNEKKHGMFAFWTLCCRLQT